MRWLLTLWRQLYSLQLELTRWAGHLTLKYFSFLLHSQSLILSEDWVSIVRQLLMLAIQLVLVVRYQTPRSTTGFETWKIRNLKFAHTVVKNANTKMLLGSTWEGEKFQATTENMHTVGPNNHFSSFFCYNELYQVPHRPWNWCYNPSTPERTSGRVCCRSHHGTGITLYLLCFQMWE